MNKNVKKILTNLIKWTPFPSLLLLITFLAITAITTNNFFSGGFVSGYLNANIPLVAVSLGVAVVLIGGGIDISLGSIVCLVNVFIVTRFGTGMPFGMALVSGLLIGTFAGLINGLVIAYLRITPLLTTFATSSIYLGLSLTILQSPGGSVPIDFVLWYIGSTLNISNSLVFLIFGILVWLYIKKSKIGIWLYAVGENSPKAYVSAIPVNLVKVFIYTFAGFMASIGGIALTANVGAGDPLVGTAFTMMAIASCVIGGVMLSGGIGNAIGAVFGALFLGLVTNIVLMYIKNPFYQNFYSGLIILFGVVGAVVINTTIQKKL